MSEFPGWSGQRGAAALDLASDVATTENGLLPGEGTHESHPDVTEVDRLRTRIVTEWSQHGEWLPLTQYGPLPKRIALGIASSWRHAKPHLFGGDRHFLARIVPVTSDASSRHNRTVRSETLYAVEVSYPHPRNQNSSPDDGAQVTRRAAVRTGEGG